MGFASLEEVYGSDFLKGTKTKNLQKEVETYSDEPVPLLGTPKIKNSVEFKMAQDHVRDNPFAKAVGVDNPIVGTGSIREMRGCESLRMHLDHCPDCQQYIMERFSANSNRNTHRRGLPTFEKTEQGGGQIFEEGFHNQLPDSYVDIIALIGIGILIIFVLDSFVKLGRSLK